MKTRIIAHRGGASLWPENTLLQSIKLKAWMRRPGAGFTTYKDDVLLLP